MIKRLILLLFPSVAVIYLSIDFNKKITKNFSLSEFFCSQNDFNSCPSDYINNILLVARSLQLVRDKLAVPIFINSGWRSPSYNLRVGGAKNSFHLKGLAVDWRFQGYKKNLELFNYLSGIFTGVIFYDDFIHCDLGNRVFRKY